MLQAKKKLDGRTGTQRTFTVKKGFTIPKKMLIMMYDSCSKRRFSRNIEIKKYSSEGMLLIWNALQQECSLEERLFRRNVPQKGCFLEEILLRRNAPQKECSSEELLLRRDAPQKGTFSDEILLRRIAPQKNCSSEEILLPNKR